MFAYRHAPRVERAQPAGQLPVKASRSGPPAALPVWAQYSRSPLVQPTRPANADVMQQGGSTGTSPTAAGTACDSTYIANTIDPAYTEAQTWRSFVSRWFDAHLARIQQRGRLTRGEEYVRLGTALFNDLNLLERHFHISQEMRRTSFPYSADDLVNVRDLEDFGNASYWVRRRFGDVELSSLNYYCQVECPTARTGTEVLGSAVPGSREVTFYTRCFNAQSPTTQAGVAMHEAFHASFRNSITIPTVLKRVIPAAMQ